jgi:prepilin-type N-terminal cleavage/methylation domain-containing protein
MKARRPASGFTLIEMMVALTIFSLLLAVLLGGYSQGLSIWQRASDKSSVWQSYQNRALWMSRLVQQIVIADYRIAGSRYTDVFQGNALGFVAMSSAPILAGPGRPVPVEFKLFENLDLGYVQLLYRQADKHNDPERGMGLDGKPWVVLIDNINDASFSYFIQERREMHNDTLEGEVKPFEWLTIANWVPRQIALTFSASVDGSEERKPQRWVFTPVTGSNAALQYLSVYME